MRKGRITIPTGESLGGRATFRCATPKIDGLESSCRAEKGSARKSNAFLSSLGIS